MVVDRPIIIIAGSETSHGEGLVFPDDHSMSGSESEEEGYSDIFTEPEGFREAEKQPTFETYQLPDGSVLSLRLIGHSALWVGTVKILTTSLFRIYPLLHYSLAASENPPDLFGTRAIYCGTLREY